MKRILFGSVNLLGDSLAITPSLRAVRKKCPDSEIILLVQDEPLTRILEHNPDIDGIVYDDTEDWQRVRKLDPDKELGEFDFKHLFDITKSWNYCLREGRHMSEGYAYHLAQALGEELAIETRSPIMGFTEEELKEAEEYKGSIVFAPHSASSTVENEDGAGNKKWGRSKWVELVKYIREKNGFRLISVGSPKDTALGWEGVEEFIGNDIRKDAVMVRGCDLAIVLDNGIMHVADACRTNFICIHPRAVPTNFSRPTIPEKGFGKILRCAPMWLDTDEVIAEFNKFVEWRKM